MKHSNFEIGKNFFTGSGEWMCTDKGTRVIVGIKIDPERDSSWYKGPPFAVAESVFDEYDMEGCYLVAKHKHTENGNLVVASEAIADERAALSMVLDVLNTDLVNSDFVKVDDLLSSFDVSALSPLVTIGILTITSYAKGHLSQRAAFLAAAEIELPKKLGAKRAESLLKNRR